MQTVPKSLEWLISDIRGFITKIIMKDRKTLHNNKLAIVSRECNNYKCVSPNRVQNNTKLREEI